MSIFVRITLFHAPEILNTYYKTLGMSKMAYDFSSLHWIFSSLQYIQSLDNIHLIIYKFEIN